MKKILILVLTILMISLCILPSFADSEEDKILEAAKKGTVLYFIVTCSSEPIEHIYAEKEDLHTDPDVAYKFMLSIIPEMSNFKIIDRSPFIEILEKEGITGEERTEYLLVFSNINYVKLGETANSVEKIQELCSKYLKGYKYAAYIDDENTAEKYPNGLYKHSPLLYNFDGQPYIRTVKDGFFAEFVNTRLEDFKVLSYDKKSAKVCYETSIFDLDAPNWQRDEVYYIDLVKEDGDWKVCGGTLFSDYLGSDVFGYSYGFSPEMGEDFSLITHTLLISASAVLMAVLVRGRKRKEA